MPSINIQIELGDQFIYDILTNWVEGGFNQWACFTEINREPDTLDVISAVVQDAEWDMEEPDDMPDFKNELVDYDTIVRGLERVLSQQGTEDHVGISSDILDYISRGVREQDAGDIDAIASDCIVQAGLLGDVVYG